MAPASNNILQEPRRLPHEPEIAPCPHCGEPVASVCILAVTFGPGVFG